MATPVSLFPLAASAVPTGGRAVIAAAGPILGGFIVNPFNARDQNLAAAEVLYVDITGSAALSETATTQAIQPGGIFTFPDNLTTNVSVNAKTGGHRFAGIIAQPPIPALVPQTGTFPPSGPTTLTEIIPSYLYEQYQDDDNLQAFIAAYNSLAQGYLTWFATIGLPVYTGLQIVGSLLDWVAGGIYGMTRPTLSSGRNRDVGPFNTYDFNAIPFDVRKNIGPSNVAFTSDDVFKRIMTWNFYKGDGNVFNVRWLKRRIMRFLIGTNGTAPNVDQTYLISVTFGPGIIAIRITVGTRTITGGALFNRFGFNRIPNNVLLTLFVPGPTPLPFETIFQEAMESGALQMPLQYAISVSI